MSESSVLSHATVAGRETDAVFEPQSMDELADLLKRDDGLTLVPQGGGTMLELGNTPRGPFALVDLTSAFPPRIEHEASDLTVIASAGTTLGEIQRVLDSAKQWLPLDPPLAPEATIGGVVAVGQSGPLRTRFGLPRDFVLGMTVLRPDGELVRAGGRVVKNVTGYDLMRLWTGSLGTLGVTTEVAFKVLPRPESVELRCRFPNYGALWDGANAILTNDVRPYIVDARQAEDGPWTALVRIDAATESTVRGLLGRAEVSHAEGTAYTEMRDFGFSPKAQISLRVATIPSQVEAIVATLGHLTPVPELLVRPVVGQVRAAWHNGVPDLEHFSAALNSLRATVRPYGGSVVVELMPNAFRGAVDSWDALHEAAALMRRTKMTFDLRGRLNAGRFAGGI